jgi:hypothetical protein
MAALNALYINSSAAAAHGIGGTFTLCGVTGAAVYRYLQINQVIYETFNRVNGISVDNPAGIIPRSVSSRERSYRGPRETAGTVVSPPGKRHSGNGLITADNVRNPVYRGHVFITVQTPRNYDVYIPAYILAVYYCFVDRSAPMPKVRGTAQDAVVDPH